jgi:glutathione S-transferase
MTAWKRFIGPMMRKRDPAALNTAVAAIPTEERRIAWSTTIQDSFTEEQIAESMRRLSVSVARLERALGQSAWLAGGQYSLADIIVFNMAAALPRVVPADANPAQTPRLLEWIQRIGERPAIQAALALSRNSLRPLRE